MYGFTEEEIEKFHNKISDIVKNFRKEKGLTQLDLAIELGFRNSSFISHAENPKIKTHHYSLEHIYKITYILDIPLSTFFENLENL